MSPIICSKQRNEAKWTGKISWKYDSPNGKQHATIIDRISKGYGILANITAIFTDIPLGNKRVEIGMDLRQALWINVTLHNSEVWQELTEHDKEELTNIYHYILRFIIEAHSKAPIEHLYLETSTPVRWKVHPHTPIGCRKVILLRIFVGKLLTK